MSSVLSRHRSTYALGALTFALAAGWSVREAQFAQAQAKRINNSVVNAADVAQTDAQDNGKVVGKAQVYMDGSTPSTGNMQVGRFQLEPGQTPHAPHRHADEELLIVTRGSGEILVEGKKTPVRSGAVMYTDPNAEHAITNTGTRPLEFYWIKYVPTK